MRNHTAPHWSIASSLAFVIAFAAFVHPVKAQDPIPGGEQQESARGLAMGLGARASASSVSALYYNPAGMSIGRRYHIETAAGYEPSGSRFTFGGAVVDSYSSPFALGVSYRYLLGNGRDGHSGMEGRVAASFALGEALSIGFAGRYLSFLRQGPQIQIDGTSSPYAEGITADASIRLSPLPGLHIAALGSNLIDFGSPLVPRLVGGSLSYTIDNVVTLAFDGLANLSTYQNERGDLRPEGLFGGALEVFTGEVPIRAGYFFDTALQMHTMSAGLGFVNQQMAIELAVRQQIVGGDNTWLLLTFRYFVH